MVGEKEKITYTYEYGVIDEDLIETVFERARQFTN